MEIDPPVCPHCGTEFNKRGELATHLAKTNTVVVLHCEQCDRLFHYNKSRLVDHIKNHNLEKIDCLPSTVIPDLQAVNNTISDMKEEPITSHSSVENNCLQAKQSILENDEDSRNIKEVLRSEKSYVKKKKKKDKVIRSRSSSSSSSNMSSSSSSNISGSVTTGGNKNNVAIYTCEVCGQSFPVLSKYNKHMIQHGNREGNMEAVFIKDELSESDQEIKKEDDGFIDTLGAVFRCDECGKGFKLKESLKSHQRKHTGEKPYICNVCNKKFARNSGLLYHLKHVHMGIKAHGCDICGRTFAMKAAMEDHHRIHTGERPYVCHSCGKSFKTRASLYIHSRTHTDEFPHPCTFCNRRFRWRQQLLGHLTTHTGEKNHICDVCGKRFGVKNDLTRHKLVHSDSKPFICPICAFPFAQKRYLKNHMQSKHKVKYIDKCNLTD